MESVEDKVYFHESLLSEKLIAPKKDDVYPSNRATNSEYVPSSREEILDLVRRIKNTDNDSL